MSERHRTTLMRVLTGLALACAAAAAVRSWARPVGAPPERTLTLHRVENPVFPPERREPEVTLRPIPGVVGWADEVSPDAAGADSDGTDPAVAVTTDAGDVTTESEGDRFRTADHVGSYWGPGNPTIYSRYFMSYLDHVYETNPVYIGATHTVPRNAYGFEAWASHDLQPVGCLAPGCPMTYQYLFLDSGNDVFYWYQIDAWGGYANRQAYLTNSDRQTYWINPYGTWLRLGIQPNCQLPDGNYSILLRAFFDNRHLYDMVFPYKIGGTANQGCGPEPTPTPTPAPTPTPTPAPTPTPTPTPSPSPTARPNVPPVTTWPEGCIDTLTPTFSWTPVANATEYRLVITDAVTQVPIPITVPTTSYTPPPGMLAADREYRWWVKGQNVEYGDGPYSQPQLYFIPLCGAPREAPVTLGPQGCIETLTPTLQWTSVKRAANYRLVILEVGSSEIVDQPLVSGTSYTVPPGRLGKDTDYRWKVKAGNAQGAEGSYSWPDVYFTPFCGSRELEEDPAIREEDSAQTPCDALPPSSVGRPVNVATGNMHLDQVDLAVPGVGPDLVFSRSYNSANVTPGTYGSFGRGWSHPYEQSLTLMHHTVLMLRQADGSVIYFRDQNEDFIYEPSVPSSEQSSIARRPDGTYERRFRAGGAQSFDAAGRLIALTDPVGNATTLSRDGAGRLTSISDSGGRALTLTYTGDLLTTVAAPGGAESSSYTYDAGGQLASVTYGDGSGYRFAYDGAGRLLSVTDASEIVIESHTYDADGRALTSSISQGQESYTLQYEPFRTTVTDGLGHVTVYDYVETDQVKRLARISGPCASCGGGSDVQEWSYDRGGRVTKHKRIGADGAAATTEYFYDALTGDLLFEKDPLEQMTTYEHFADGRVKTITRPDGSTKRFTYVAAGPATVTETVVDGETLTTSYTYTSQGKLHTVTGPDGAVTTFAYGAAGDLASITDAAGTTTFRHDELGRRTGVTDALGNMTQTFYDQRGRVRRISPPDRYYRWADHRFHYDTGGRLIRMIQGPYRETRFVYDAFGRMEDVVDALGGVTRHGYDIMSRLASVADANGNQTQFDRDGHGRVTATEYPGGAREALTYDGLGRRATRTDRRGVVTTYDYDALGRMLSKTYSDDTPAVSYTYDPVGRLLSAANGTDTLSWTYDQLGRILTETSARNQSTLAYTYDDASNRLTTSVNGVPHFTYAYDALSRMTSVTYKGQEFTFGYDALSRRTTLQYPNGVLTSYEYDEQSRLTSLAAVHGGAAIARFTYGYDLAGNRQSRSDLDQPERSASYTYDLLNRLTSESRNGSTTQYTFDAVGNRLTEETGGVVLSSTYDQRNQLVSQAAGGVPTAAFTYDANGNLASKTEGGTVWSYHWNAENQLIRVMRDGAEIARFAYDPLGRRVEKAAGGVARTYIYDGVDIIRDTVGASVFTYVHGPGIDEPLARENETGAWRYLHADGLGSIMEVTTASGARTGTLDYAAFGERVTGTPSRQPYGYTGREWDEETALYYYRARYYDPRIGRFLSEDPQGLRSDANLYAYAGGNPVNRIDPSGEIWLPASITNRARKWLLAAFIGASGKKSKEYEAIQKALADTKVVHTTKGGKIRQGTKAGLCVLAPPGLDIVVEDLFDELFPAPMEQADPVLLPDPLV